MNEYETFEMRLLKAKPWVIEGYKKCMAAFYSLPADVRSREVNRIFDQAEEVRIKAEQEFRQSIAMA